MDKIQKYNELLQEIYLEDWNNGVKVVECLAQIKTGGKRLIKRWTITLQKLCGSQKELSEDAFRSRKFDMNNFEPCAIELCKECKPLRFDFLEYKDRERGGILQIDLNTNDADTNDVDTKNSGGINPLCIRNNSTTPLPFICNNEKCSHFFIISPSRIKQDKNGKTRACPYCVKSAKKLCGDPNCTSICSSRTIINHDNPHVMQYLSPNNKIDLKTTFKHSNLDLILICPGCEDEHIRNNLSINKTTELFCKNCIDNKTNRKNTKCSSCENIFVPVVKNKHRCNCCMGAEIPSIPLCGKEKCLKCYDRSFKKRYEDEKIKHVWNIKNGSILLVSRKSGKQYSLFCAISGKEFTTNLNRIFISCTNKYCCGKYTTEDYIKQLVFEITNHHFYKTRSLSWLVDDITGNNLELDLYNVYLKIAFEYQGKQHYELTFHNDFDPIKLENIKRKDDLKIKLCKENNIKLVVIPYTIQLNKLYEYIKGMIEEE